MANTAMTRIISVCRIISALALAFMAILTFVDVAGRKLAAPVFGAAEMIQFALAITVFAGMALASAGNNHVKVDILEPLLQRRAPHVHRLLLQSTAVLAFGLMAAQLVWAAWHAAVLGRESIVLGWPLFPLLLVSAVLMVAALTVDLLSHHDSAGGDEIAPEEHL